MLPSWKILPSSELHTVVTSPTLFDSKILVVSSANTECEKINLINKSGPRWLPWGTPLIINLVTVKMLPILVTWLQLDRKLHRSASSKPHIIPYISSFCRRIPWFLQSKAFVRSIKIVGQTDLYLLHQVFPLNM